MDKEPPLDSSLEATPEDSPTNNVIDMANFISAHQNELGSRYAKLVKNLFQYRHSADSDTPDDTPPTDSI